MKAPLGVAFLRLFTLQSSWNYERMVGIGAGVAAEPLLRALGAPDAPAYRAALARAAGFFNAHPYLAGLAVGAGARAERDGVPPEQIERLRTALIGPLGAIGDRVVWAGWLPLLAALALIGVARGGGWWAVIGFLVVYNAGHVALRWWALAAGWRRGLSVGAALQHPVLRTAERWLGPATALALGAALPVVARELSAPLGDGARLGAAAVAVAGFTVMSWRPAVLSGLRLGLLAVTGALLVGWLWP